MNRNTTSTIVSALQSDSDLARSGLNRWHRNSIAAQVNQFLVELEGEALHHLACNTKPLVPADDPPAAKEYPSREELHPEENPAPDPAETEHAPDESAWAEFKANIDRILELGKTLFEAEASNRKDQRARLLLAMNKARGIIVRA